MQDVQRRKEKWGEWDLGFFALLIVFLACTVYALKDLLTLIRSNRCPLLFIPRVAALQDDSVLRWVPGAHCGR